MMTGIGLMRRTVIHFGLRCGQYQFFPHRAHLVNFRSSIMAIPSSRMTLLILAVLELTLSYSSLLNILKRNSDIAHDSDLESCSSSSVHDADTLVG